MYMLHTMKIEMTVYMCQCVYRYFYGIHIDTQSIFGGENRQAKYIFIRNFELAHI